MIECCGQEMTQAGEWWHCLVCGKRLVERPYGEDQRIMADMIVEYVQEYQPTWKEFGKTIQELWRQGHYEDYTPELPEGFEQVMDRIEEVL